MQKGEKLSNLFIETMGSEGKTIARYEGLIVFLQGGAPGDTVEAEVTKIKSNYLEGRVTTIQQFSPHRAIPFCGHFGTCGGCSWQHINYETQLVYKQKQVVDNLERIGGLQLPAVKPILASSKINYYRNRLDFTFSADRWLTKDELARPAEERGRPEALGFHIPRMYDRVFDVLECHLQPEPSNAIRLACKDIAVKEGIAFFDLRKQIGYLRTLTIRTAQGPAGPEVMVILQVAYDRPEWMTKIMDKLSEFSAVTSLNYVINGKRNDTFHDLEIVCYRGKPWITETMPSFDGTKELQFRVGPKSFYQTNSGQAYHLYKAAAEVADLTGKELVYDLYTGTGTIANFVAGKSKNVIGLEYVSAAIDDAKINSQINGISNTEFFAGDIKDLLDESFLSAHGKPVVVITDPPRVGMHEDVNRMLLNAEPERIVYVSCNPATQARDLKLLSEKYSITSVQPVDMFPQTMHVENIVRLDIIR
jgi:23S rRNA (uracil1939-C5)-methyltransferase